MPLIPLLGFVLIVLALVHTIPLVLGLVIGGALLLFGGGYVGRGRGYW